MNLIASAMQSTDYFHNWWRWWSRLKRYYNFKWIFLFRFSFFFFRVRNINATNTQKYALKLIWENMWYRLSGFTIISARRIFFFFFCFFNWCVSLGLFFSSYLVTNESSEMNEYEFLSRNVFFFFSIFACERNSLECIVYVLIFWLLQHFNPADKMEMLTNDTKRWTKRVP